jgi:hypothetical protein
MRLLVEMELLDEKKKKQKGGRLGCCSLLLCAGRRRVWLYRWCIIKVGYIGSTNVNRRLTYMFFIYRAPFDIGNVIRLSRKKEKRSQTKTKRSSSRWDSCIYYHIEARARATLYIAPRDKPNKSWRWSLKYNVDKWNFSFLFLKNTLQ